VIRSYVYEGWNEDAEGRRVFDGIHTHTGSSGLFQNQRFAQVDRYPRQYEEHQWPVQYYPLQPDHSGAPLGGTDLTLAAPAQMLTHRPRHHARTSIPRGSESLWQDAGKAFEGVPETTSTLGNLGFSH
jgi:hypothetical protein